MDERTRAIARELRNLSSEAAADWLLEHYPPGSSCGTAFAVMPHRSWTRTDQKRLARAYLRRVPFASARPYEVFASFMSIGVLIEIFEENRLAASRDLDLFLYHIEPVLRKAARTAADRERASGFVERLKAERRDPATADFADLKRPEGEGAMAELQELRKSMPRLTLEEIRSAQHEGHKS